MVCGIYKILNIKNNKFYIGSSKDIDKRFHHHFYQLELGIHLNPKLQIVI